MEKLKRLPVKYIRDRAKARYRKDTECRICGTDSDLQFHHTKTVHILVENWMRKTGVAAEDVVDWRDDFIAEHETELYKDAVTLCKKHHDALHKIYGVKPSLATSAKQVRWVERQRAKHGLDGKPVD